MARAHLDHSAKYFMFSLLLLPPSGERSKKLAGECGDIVDSQAKRLAAVGTPEKNPVKQIAWLKRPQGTSSPQVSSRSKDAEPATVCVYHLTLFVLEHAPDPTHTPP